MRDTPNGEMVTDQSDRVDRPRPFTRHKRDVSLATNRVLILIGIHQSQRL